MSTGSEFRKLVFAIFMVFICFIFGVFILLNVYNRDISKGITDQNTAIVGAVVKNNPDLESTIVPIVTKEVLKEDYNLGKEILDKYSYDEFLSTRDQIAISLPISNLTYGLLAILIFSFLIVLFLIWIYTKSYTRQIERLYMASERVINGDFSYGLMESGEGSISILNHQFNKMMYIIKNNYENFNQEKIFLKDTISDISHQLKTPLSSLVMFNDLMLDDEDMDLETRREFLLRSRDQHERMQWLIVNLLKIARIEAGAITFKKEKVRFEDVIDSAQVGIGGNLMKKNQKIVKIGDMSTCFIGDFEWTEEAVSNILKNATEHAPENSNIEVEITNTSTTSMLSIKNNGDLIPEKDINYIFRRFYRASSSSDSVGIGLNLTKSIVEGQGGVISVENLADGVKFTISFMRENKGEENGNT